MSRETGIEWTDATWNPIRGCSRVSEGCRNCYAETVANRFCGPGAPYEGVVQLGADGKGNGKWNGQIKFVEKHLLDPLKWNPIRHECQACGTDHLPKDCDRGLGARPRRIFVNSMSDLFHEKVTDEMLDRIFAVMALCPQHTFQVLTKRPERMKKYLSQGPFNGCTGGRTTQMVSALLDITTSRQIVDYHTPLGRLIEGSANVHLGVSVENQKAADERIPLLLQTPAAVRFVSCEPLLGEVLLDVIHREPSDFDRSLKGFDRCTYTYLQALEGANGIMMDDETCHEEPIGTQPRLDWVIVGGESGPGARPMHPDWARSLRDQCVEAGVPFFFKQWGEWGAGSVNMTSGEPVFREFTDFMQWVHKGDTWINGGLCFDAAGKHLKTGGDMKTAVFPVTVMHRVGKKSAGALLDGREWREMPR